MQNVSIRQKSDSIFGEILILEAVRETTEGSNILMTEDPVQDSFRAE